MDRSFPSLQQLAVSNMCPSEPFTRIYPGFESLPFVSTHTYQQLAAARGTFGRNVSPASFDYYAAVCTVTILKSLLENEFGVLPVEHQIYNYTGELNLRPPAPISTYLDALNFTTPKYKISCRHPEYMQGSNGILGYFGRVSDQTHWQYAAYPCLAVYAQRIKQDILFTSGKDISQWNLPENIRPEFDNAGFPTENMLGWKPAEMIVFAQMEFLKRSGYDCDGNCTFTSERYPINSLLLSSIQSELDALSVQIAPIYLEIKQKLISLLALTETTDDNREGPILSSTLKVISSVAIEDTVEYFRVLSSLYRLSRNSHFCNWCVYNWNNYKNVPASWQESCNTLRLVDGLVPFNKIEYGPYSLNHVVEIFVGSYFNQEDERE